jgi:hypothetical protein
LQFLTATVNQPYLRDNKVFNDLLIHVNKGPVFGVAVKAGVWGNKVDVLGGPCNGSVGDDGRLRSRPWMNEVEMLEQQKGPVEG